jgi:hypothetical protein
MSCGIHLLKASLIGCRDWSHSLTVYSLKRNSVKSSKLLCLQCSATSEVWENSTTEHLFICLFIFHSILFFFHKGIKTWFIYRNEATGLSYSINITFCIIIIIIIIYSSDLGELIEQKRAWVVDLWFMNMSSWWISMIGWCRYA